jgi:hypothetical protein
LWGPIEISVEELHQHLLELAKAWNQNTEGGTSIPATFLRVACLGEFALEFLSRRRLWA